MAVELGLEDQRRRLAVARPVGQTTVHHVAAGDGAGGRVLLGLVLPQDLARIVERQGEGRVRERRVDIHHAVDDEGCALVAVKDAGREGPRRAQVLDVVLVDLGHRTEVGLGIVATGRDPVLVALGEFDELVVRNGGTRAGRKAARNQRRHHGLGHCRLVSNHGISPRKWFLVRRTHPAGSSGPGNDRIDLDRVRSGGPRLSGLPFRRFARMGRRRCLEHYSQAGSGTTSRLLWDTVIPRRVRAPFSGIFWRNRCRITFF
ncbi:hypothetical protein A6302_00849 [Methylobrevis pamukkalensis]|uniref:Uncharacterized protein n=1 Tax=Methylobrevis pamukkalensis TaxID=1439726 RepID=A0A1E3H669_9HYPH|nr:hypothetical protein A6302_00849 [Methylobrevis pamukkalensis]